MDTQATGYSLTQLFLAPIPNSIHAEAECTKPFNESHGTHKIASTHGKHAGNFLHDNKNLELLVLQPNAPKLKSL